MTNRKRDLSRLFPRSISRNISTRQFKKIIKVPKKGDKVLIDGGDRNLQGTIIKQKISNGVFFTIKITKDPKMRIQKDDTIIARQDQVVVK